MKKTNLSACAMYVVVAACALPVLADEGMWTFNNFPSDKVQKSYGFKPSQEWLDKVRLSSARLAQGCSGSFVSPDGLIMTNHHCARRCIAQLSTKQKDFLHNGFVTKSTKDEVKCPELEINQLVDIKDVTQRMSAATASKTGAAYAEAQRTEIARITKECATSDDVRCDVVSLYKGAVHNLYTYKRYQDVRLVFAPEEAIAFFGGDPDNFNFPRYDLDAAFVRIYENGKPAQVKNYFPFAKTATKAGDLTFVSGHPGHTSREYTVSELAFQRDYVLPARLMRLAEMRGQLTQFMLRGKEERRIATTDLFSVENAYKALKGRHAALLDQTFFASKVKAQNDLIAAVKDPAKKTELQKALGDVDSALGKMKDIYLAYTLIEGAQGFTSDLFPKARALVRAADELPLPNEKRLKEFSDASLPALKQSVESTAPVYKNLEILKLTFGLTKLRELLGADDALVKKILGKKSPETLAAELINGTKLHDPKERKRLWDGGKKAIDGSKDPLIVFARLIDADARAVRKNYEDNVESVADKASEVIAKARFAAWGTSVYPDATFTLRLSYGAVAGWKERGVDVKPVTTLGGAFERHTGEDPFKLPDSWLRAKGKLDMNKGMNLVTTNDIIGGNSGSPVINKDAEVVGLIFDGNIHSLGGEYGFNPQNNRAVAVHTDAMLEAIEKIYGAKALAEELGGKRPTG